jgi:hypothetical protein
MRFFIARQVFDIRTVAFNLSADPQFFAKINQSHQNAPILHKMGTERL